MTWRSRTAILTATIGAVVAALTLPPAVDASTYREISGQEAKTWKPDMNRAWRYALGRAGDITIAATDMRGVLRTRSATRTVPMASTFKVMLMVAYLRQSGVRHRNLTDQERSLLKPMIRKSADPPADALDNRLGQGPLVRLARKAGMKSFSWHHTWGLSRTSARDQARFMRRLRRYVPSRHWSFVRRQLVRIVPSQRWGVGRVDRRGWQLLFKGGWGSGSGAVNHQVVLLRKDGHRIGMAVTTTNSPSHAYASKTLEQVFKRLLRRLPR